MSSVWLLRPKSFLALSFGEVGAEAQRELFDIGIGVRGVRLTVFLLSFTSL